MRDEIKIIGVEECLNNSRELLESAKILFENKRYNHSYHLVTLALEEIGKSEIVLIDQLPPVKDRNKSYKGHLDDHIKKLFWAFFGPMFGAEVITKESLENTEGLATKIHNQRMQGLYVDVENDVLSIPQNIDLQEETKRLISLVESRLDLEIYQKQFTTYQAEPEILQWFISATDDDEKRKGIMSHNSMKKLVELGNVKDWIKWLKELYEKADEDNKNFLETELKKEVDINKMNEPKWKVKFRLFSDSHKIKQKELNEWNEYFPYIKLNNVPDNKHKQEILVEILAPKSVHIKQVFNYCWLIQRTFLLAINIGTFGFFWWDIPKYRNKFYESAYDIENKAPFEMEIRPALKIDWRKDKLSSNELKMIALCFSQIPKIKLAENENPFNYYFGGLVFLGLNNLNFRCEDQSYMNFYLCFKYALKYYKVWDGNTDYSLIFSDTIKSFGIEQKIANEFLEMGEGTLNKNYNGDKITLEQVGSMKVVCDAFIQKRFNELIRNKKEV
ncbi:MAG: AbiV family abortive infection protein [Candidatus Lokiarchaeota archaeon]|nr:AbiV family abortive infection protein [Candidatus Lokiarchaeota archaeon]